MKPRKCPKCGNAPKLLQEKWKTCITFDATKDGLWDGGDGSLGEGEPSGGVYGICLCGHSWRLRGVSQITDLATKD